MLGQTLILIDALIPGRVSNKSVILSLKLFNMIFLIDDETS